MDQRHTEGVLTLIAASALWSVSTLMGLLPATADSMVIATTRTFLALVVFLPYGHRMGLRLSDLRWAVVEPCRQIVHFGRGQIGAPVLFGGLALSILGAGIATSACTILFSVSTRMTYPPIALAALYASPALAAFCRPRHTSRREWLVTIGVCAGISLRLCDNYTKTDVFGVVLALLSGACWIGATVLMKRFDRKAGLLSYIVAALMSGLVGIPFVAAHPGDTDLWVKMVLLGIFGQGVPLIIFHAGLRKVKSSLEALQLGTLEPVFGALLYAAVSRTLPGPFTTAGLVLIIGTLAWHYGTLKGEGRK